MRSNNLISRHQFYMGIWSFMTVCTSAHLVYKSRCKDQVKAVLGLYIGLSIDHAVYIQGRGSLHVPARLQLFTCVITLCRSWTGYNPDKLID